MEHVLEVKLCGMGVGSPSARRWQVMWWCRAHRSVGSFNLSWLEEDVNQMGNFVFELIGWEGWGM
jgi:hypothetical protein